MLPLRDRSFSHRAQHFLDGCAEYNDVNGSILTAVSLYGNPDRVNHIVDRNRTTPGMVMWNEDRTRVKWDGESTEDKHEALTNYALEELFPQIDEPRRKGLVWRGLLCELDYLETQAEWLADCALGDMVEGGCLIKWRQHRRLDVRGKMYKNDIARLHSPNYIRHYIKQHYDPRRDLGQLDTARERWGMMTALEAKYGATDDDAVHLRILNDIGALWARFNSQIRQAALRTVPDKKRRKILKRAAALVVAILGASTMTALARGEPIVIPGQKFDLQLIVPDLLQKGHGGINVSVFDKDKRHSLAKLCVYVKDTLAIDQVVSMALHMQSGLEDEILKTANVTDYENGGDEHPIFVERARQQNLERQATRERFDQFVREQQEVFPPPELVNLQPIAGQALPYIPTAVPMGQPTIITSPFNVTNIAQTGGVTTWVCTTNQTGMVGTCTQYVTSPIAVGSSTNVWIGPIYTQLPSYNPHEVIRSYQRKYWEETREIWEEAVRVRVMGARVAKFWGQKVRKAA